MNKKEKFEKLFKDYNPDEIVPFHPILMHFAARFNNITYGRFASDYRALVESNIKALEFFDMDMVSLISDPYRETSAFGAKIEFIDEGVPRCLNKIIKSIDDVKELKNPDVYKSARTLDRIKGAGLYQNILKGSVPVCGWIEGPLAEACDMAGVSEMLVYLMTEPDLSGMLMDKCMVTARDFAKAQIEEGCDVIGMGDAICSQIGADVYDAYVKERHRELIEFIHSNKARVKVHICGNIKHLLPSFKELNIDIIDIDWMVDMEEVYSILGPGVVCSGNINPVVIQDLNHDELFNLTRDLLQKEQSHPFILSGGCEITVNTPVNNLKAMDNARKEAIRY